MKYIVCLFLVLILLLMPMQVAAENIYPSMSYYTVIEASNEKFLVSDEGSDFVVIFRNNGSEVQARFEFFNTTHLIGSQTINVENFTLLSVTMPGTATILHLIGINNGLERIVLYMDLYKQKLSDILNDTIILFAIDLPANQTLIVTEYVPVMVVQIETVTEYVTVIQTKVIFSYFINELAAGLVAVGGICILAVYAAIRLKQKEDKPIKKMTLDELLEEFRKGG